MRYIVASFIGVAVWFVSYFVLRPTWAAFALSLCVAFLFLSIYELIEEKFL